MTNSFNKKFLPKWSVLCLLLSCCCLSGNSWSQNVDSLRSVLKEHAFNDTTRVNLIVKLADTYLEVFSDSTAKEAEEGYKLATKIKFEKGRADCLWEMGSGYYSAHNYDRAKTALNQALDLAKEIGYAKVAAQCLQKLGSLSFRQNKRALAEEYLKEAIALYQRMGDNDGVADANLSLGTIVNDAARSLRLLTITSAL